MRRRNALINQRNTKFISAKCICQHQSIANDYKNMILEAQFSTLQKTLPDK